MASLNVDIDEMRTSLTRFIGTFEDLPKSYEAAMNGALELAQESGAPALIETVQQALDAMPEVMKNYRGAIETMVEAKRYYDKTAAAIGKD